MEIKKAILMSLFMISLGIGAGILFYPKAEPIRAVTEGLIYYYDYDYEEPITYNCMIATDSLEVWYADSMLFYAKEGDTIYWNSEDSVWKK